MRCNFKKNKVRLCPGAGRMSVGHIHVEPGETDTPPSIAFFPTMIKLVSHAENQAKEVSQFGTGFGGLTHCISSRQTFRDFIQLSKESHNSKDSTHTRSPSNHESMYELQGEFQVKTVFSSSGKNE